jgi:hypothetical protein
LEQIHRKSKLVIRQIFLFISNFRNYEIFRYQHAQRLTSIDVVWYPSLDSNNALLSTIPRIHDHLTFKQFQQLFKKQPMYRYEGI